MYVLSLRQLEGPPDLLGAAYDRLAAAASAAVGQNLRTVILDWLEAELKILQQAGEAAGTSGTQLMRAAVSLSNALKQ